MPKKIVTVIKETRVRYEVESSIDQKGQPTLTDDQAIDVVKERMKVDAPIGLLETKEKVKAFEVAEGYAQ